MFQQYMKDTKLDEYAINSVTHRFNVTMKTIYFWSYVVQYTTIQYKNL